MTQSTRCTGTVVVIDDEEDTRELMKELLEERGVRTVLAADGVAGLELLRATPDVCFVVLDLLMPRLGGVGVLRAMAQDPALAMLQVCVSTSAPDQVPAGVPCLPKPIDIARLFALVDAHCAAGRSSSGGASEDPGQQRA